MMTKLSRRTLFLGMASAAFAAVVGKVAPYVPKSLAISRLATVVPWRRSLTGDAAFDLESYLFQEFAEKMAIQEDNKWLSNWGAE